MNMVFTSRTVDALLLDGPAMGYMIESGTHKTSKAHMQRIFYSKSERQINECEPFECCGCFMHQSCLLPEMGSP